MQGSKKLSILIPVYNEEKTITRLLDRVCQVRLDPTLAKEIIIVNDCSTDRTREEVDRYLQKHNREATFNFISHEVNRGKGAAIHTAIAQATGDYILIQDADLEYDPKDYQALLQPLLDGVADVVYGSRFLGGHAHRVLFFWHFMGNNFLTFISNMFTNLNLTDMETCYKVFKKEILQKIKLKEKRFGFEPEVTAKIAKIPHIQIYEVGISYYGRTYHEGKKVHWKDGVRALYCILKYNLF